MNPYQYSTYSLPFNLNQISSNRYYHCYIVEFTAAFHGVYQQSSRVTGEYYRPLKGDKHQLAILLHGSGRRSILPLRLLVRSLTKRGIACLITYQAIHPNRMPRQNRKRYPWLSPEEWFEIYQTSVIEVRQIIDWAITRQEIDHKKILLIGLSFGGFIAAIAMGVDERVRSGIFFVMGGNTGKIHYRGMLSRFTTLFRRVSEAHQGMQESYMKYLVQIEGMGLYNTEPPQRSFLIDPMTYAHRLRERPVLMINARWDEVIPREATLDFWQQTGKPPIFFYPTTHASLWLWYPSIVKKVVHFLDSASPD